MGDTPPSPRARHRSAKSMRGDDQRRDRRLHRPVAAERGRRPQHPRRFITQIDCSHSVAWIPPIRGDRGHASTEPVSTGPPRRGGCSGTWVTPRPRPGRDIAAPSRCVAMIRAMIGAAIGATIGAQSAGGGRARSKTAASSTLHHANRLQSKRCGDSAHRVPPIASRHPPWWSGINSGPASTAAIDPPVQTGHMGNTPPQGPTASGKPPVDAPG
jgi:hypothetical protein